MRYLVGFVLAVALVVQPIGAGAQFAEEDSPSSWQEREPRPPSEGMAAPSAGRDPGALVAPEDKALVVFVRPVRWPVAPEFYVYDATKELLTFFGATERAAIAVEPGRHTFYVVRKKNAELVRASVDAGRTYVVHTKPRYALPGVAVAPTPRDSLQFAESAKWLRTTKVAEPDFAQGYWWTSEHQSWVNTAIAEAEAEWSRMDTQARAARTVSAEDGRTQEEMLALALAGWPVSISAQADEDDALSEEPASDEPRRHPHDRRTRQQPPEPREPALELKLDDAGVEVAPRDSWPGEAFRTPEETETLLRLKRSRTGLVVGLSVGASFLAVGAMSLGLSYFCIGECETPASPGLFNAGLIMMGVGAAAMITSGALYGVRKRQLRNLEHAHRGKPRRVQWDLARSRLVF